MGDAAKDRRLALVPDDDATLVARVREGDRSAFAALYRRHHRYVAGVAYRVFGDDDELEDTVQEVFLEAHRGLHTLSDPSRIRPWLVTIAVRRAQRRIGKRVRRRRVAAAVFSAGPRCGDPRDQQPVQVLYQALAQLEEKLRWPWILRQVEGYALAEVAEMCEVSIATVKRRIRKAQSRLDRRLPPGHAASLAAAQAEVSPRG